MKRKEKQRMSGRAAQSQGTIKVLDAHAELLARLKIGEGILGKCSGSASYVRDEPVQVHIIIYN